MNTFAARFNLSATWTCLLVVIATIFVSGCKSLDQPASASFAWVTIANQTPDQIRQATDKVFANAGYESVKLPDGTQVYEREATKRERIAYAGFAGAQEGEHTIARVRMGLKPQGTAYLLDCKAYVITSPGDFVNEKSHALFGFQSKPYQKLLNDVRDNLKVAAMQAAETP